MLSLFVRAGAQRADLCAIIWRPLRRGLLPCSSGTAADVGVDFIEEIRRLAPGLKIPSASAAVRFMLRDFMERHPIGPRQESSTNTNKPAIDGRGEAEDPAGQEID